MTAGARNSASMRSNEYWYNAIEMGFDIISRYAVTDTDAGLRPKRVGHYANSSSSTLASFRSGASKPSVNQL